MFQNFANRASRSIIINADYELCRSLAHNKPCLTFSTRSNDADFYATNIRPLPGGTQYDFNGTTYTLNLIGEFNVANALAAIAACSEMGIPADTSAAILQDFHGTKRRLEVIGEKNNITVIDDFAHNPDKVKSSVSALRQYDGRLVIMFQPHGFGPMRALGKEIMAEFVHNMNDDDVLIMPEIFFVGGTVTKDISSADLIDCAKQLGKKEAYFVADKAAAANKILQIAKSGDRIVIMGARDNSLTDLCRQILEKL